MTRLWPQSHLEDDDGGAVVEQALALHERPEALRDAQLLHKGHHGHGVRRAQNSANHHTRVPGPTIRVHVQHVLEHERRQDRRYDHAWSARVMGEVSRKGRGNFKLRLRSHREERGREWTRADA